MVLAIVRTRPSTLPLHFAVTLSLLTGCGRVSYVSIDAMRPASDGASRETEAVDATDAGADSTTDLATAPDALPVLDAATDQAADVEAGPDVQRVEVSSDALADAPDALDVMASDVALDAATDIAADIATDAGGVLIFAHTGSAQTFVVPSGVTSLTVKLWGGAGASSRPDMLAGRGGFVSHAGLAVTPGETLTVIVAGGGELHPGVVLGGFGGGGNGSDHPLYSWGGGGGGRSAIQRGGVDLVSAGGGGGQGYGENSGEGGSGCAGPEGAGGNATGAGAGLGGQLGAGGAGGPGVVNGRPGVALRGGHGLLTSEGSLTASGGGGGGLYGGGSGGHTFGSVSGAGGGGSCLVPAGGSVGVAGTTSDPDDDGTAGRAVPPSTMTIGQPVTPGNAGRVVLRW